VHIDDHNFVSSFDLCEISVEYVGLYLNSLKFFGLRRPVVGNFATIIHLFYFLQVSLIVNLRIEVVGIFQNFIRFTSLIFYIKPDFILSVSEKLIINFSVRHRTDFDRRFMSVVIIGRLLVGVSDFSHF